MELQTVSIAPRFRGPARSGNGGYVCGLIGGKVDGTASVRLFAPPPLEAELALLSDADSVKLLHGEVLIGEARGATLDLTPPAAPTLEQATVAAAKYTGFQHHPFPGCFVCGPQRDDGDGLHIFAGPLSTNPLGDAGIVASPWHVHASLAVDGKIPDEILWSALDCPGAFAVMPDMRERAIVLGQLTARIDKPVSVGQHCIVIGWPLARDGRKHFAGSAVFSEQGELIALAKAAWFEVEKGRFE